MRPLAGRLPVELSEPPFLGPGAGGAAVRGADCGAACGTGVVVRVDAGVAGVWCPSALRCRRALTRGLAGRETRMLFCGKRAAGLAGSGLASPALGGAPTRSLRGARPTVPPNRG